MTLAPPASPATHDGTLRRAPRRADWRFMCSHPAHWLALGAGSGLSPIAPGTVGTLWAWLAFVVFDLWLSHRQWAMLLAAALPIGWWACTVTARNLGTGDPGQVVWDEVIAFWLVLWVLTPAGFGMQLAAFVLFRWLDAAKPGPVGWADRLIQPRAGRIGWREGWGILVDDLVAAGCTLLLLAAFVSLQGRG